MARQLGEHVVPGLHVERRARRGRALLADHLLALLSEDGGQLAGQQRGLLRREQAGQEQEALLLELGQLRWCELHGALLFASDGWAASAAIDCSRLATEASACSRARRSAVSGSPRD